MLSQSGLRMEELPEETEIVIDEKNPLIRVHTNAAQGARLRRNRTESIYLVSEEDDKVEWPPGFKLFTKGEDGGVGVSSYGALALDKAGDKLNSTYRSGRVKMHLIVCFVALVNIAMSIMLVWIWNFKPHNFLHYTYLCELRYEQATEVVGPQVPFSPDLVYRPALLFGSWVMLPYAMATVIAIFFLLRALLLYFASANFVRSVERNPQLSYDIWEAIDDSDNISALDFAPGYMKGDVEKIKEGNVRMKSLLTFYDEKSELILHAQYVHLETVTREQFNRVCFWLFYFLFGFTLWYYFRMIYDSDAYVGLRNNPMGYRSHFRMGLIQFDQDIDAATGAGFFGEMHGHAPTCIPKDGLEWKDVPVGSVDYNVQGIRFPSNLVNLWTCVVVHLVSAAIISSWAYGHVTIMGPKSGMTRRSVLTEKKLQDKVKSETEAEDVREVLREHVQGGGSTPSFHRSQHGIDWTEVEKNFVSMDFKQINDARKGPVWKWSIALSDEKEEKLHWGLCSSLCGRSRRAWMNTVTIRFCEAVKQLVISIACCCRCCCKEPEIHSTTVATLSHRDDPSPPPYDLKR